MMSDSIYHLSKLEDLVENLEPTGWWLDSEKVPNDYTKKEVIVTILSSYVS